MVSLTFCPHSLKFIFHTVCLLKLKCKELSQCRRPEIRNLFLLHRLFPYFPYEKKTRRIYKGNIIIYQLSFLHFIHRSVFPFASGVSVYNHCSKSKCLQYGQTFQLTLTMWLLKIPKGSNNTVSLSREHYQKY